MITDSRIAWGDQLGAQLTTLANLFYVAEENEQQLVLWEELKNYRRGYQFLDVFDIDDIEIIKRSGKLKSNMVSRYCSRSGKKDKNWRKTMQRFYNNKIIYYMDRIMYELVRLDYKDFIRITEDTEGGVHLSPALQQLNSNKNYDINGGFGTYQDWKKYEDIILNRISFKKEVMEKAAEKYNAIKTRHKYRIAVHFRRTDYLVLASLCLDNEYYKQAMSLFDSDQSSFLIFSDDIDEIKDLELFKGRDVVLVRSDTAGVDMCLMSMCNANIIANSSYSFWAAMLNKHKDKTVVCPHDFIGEQCSSLCYMNGNWYPDNWIALKRGIENGFEKE